MYEYRRLTPEQQAELVAERLSRGFPPHSPPHQVRDHPYYLLTAACYEHKCHMTTASRRQHLLNRLFEKFVTNEIDLLAWVVLPNHYHLLVHVTNFDTISNLIRLVHGPISREWNIEENVIKFGIIIQIEPFVLKDITIQLSTISTTTLLNMAG